MNKVKFKVKLTGLEIEFEGTKDDMRQVSSNIGQQLTGLMQPGLSDTTDVTQTTKSQIVEDADAVVIPSNSSKKTRKTRSGATSKVEKAKAVDFVNDISAYSAPTQKWTAVEKGLWILYVVDSLLSLKELSAGEVAETFNKHFRQQGTIRASNISRDFGSKKSGSSALVGENTTTNPHKWFLTEEGKKTIQTLISNQKNNGPN
jgi:hypothetical protein